LDLSRASEQRLAINRRVENCRERWLYVAISNDAPEDDMILAVSLAAAVAFLRGTDRGRPSAGAQPGLRQRIGRAPSIRENKAHSRQTLRARIVTQ
jgi:hypothetical protein